MTTLSSKVQELLRLTVRAIEPYQNEIVLIGGVAKHWYSNLSGYVNPGFEPMSTIDIDLALPEPLALRGGSTLHQRLMDQHLTMKEILGLDNRPAICRYYLPGITHPRADDPYLECLVPMRGPDRDSAGNPQGPPLVASAVRFLDLVTTDALQITIPEIGTLKIPHPFAYIIQKTRIRSKRRPEKQAKDQADVFYVAMSFRSQWAEWSTMWHRWRSHSPEWSAWLTTVQNHWTDLYATPTSAGSREVQSMNVGMPSDLIARIMQDFVRHITTPLSPSRDGETV